MKLTLIQGGKADESDLVSKAVAEPLDLKTVVSRLDPKQVVRDFVHAAMEFGGIHNVDELQTVTSIHDGIYGNVVDRTIASRSIEAVLDGNENPVLEALGRFEEGEDGLLHELSRVLRRRFGVTLEVDFRLFGESRKVSNLILVHNGVARNCRQLLDSVKKK